MTRKFKHWVTRIFFSPVFIALPFALITIYLLPVDFNEAEIELVDRFTSSKVGQNSLIRFIDLDGDGHDEQITHFSTAIGQCAVKINTEEEKLAGQWNFDGELPAYSHPLTVFDVDRNGSKEVFVLFQRNDSVFLGGVEFRKDSALYLEQLYIDRIQRVNGKIHYQSQLHHYDLNNDGTEEILICLNAGYSEKPRKIYAYDFVKDTLISSMQTGYFNFTLRFHDLDGDGTVEILTATSSNENIETGLGIPYSDYYRWFVIYDHNLKPEFEPIRLGHGKGHVETRVFENEAGTQVFVLDHNDKSSVKTRFYFFDFGKKKLIKPDFGYDSTDVLEVFQQKVGQEQKLFVFNNNKGRLFELEQKTHPLRLLTEFRGTIEKLSMMDIDGNSVFDAIAIKSGLKSSKTVCVYPHDFDDCIEFALPVDFVNLDIGVRKTSPEKSHLVFQANEKIFEYKLKHDSQYILKTLALWAAVFLFYVLLIWAIMRIQKNMLKKRYVREKAIAELKLKSIRNQMDPHFTFNAINAIASAIYKEDRQTAYGYFSKFSKLIRSTMLYSDRMSRFLDDEIDFTIKYLEIEKFRFREKFEFHINIDDNVNLRREVPRMIVQAFAESAIANGLMHRRTGGLLEIRMKEEGNNLVITFTDNGVGIEKSREYNKEKAFKAIRIIDEFIHVFNELNKEKITYKMFDTMEGNSITGTKVIVLVPLGIKYAFGQ